MNCPYDSCKGAVNSINSNKFKKLRSIDSVKYKILSCTECRHSFLDPIPSDKEIEMIYKDYHKVGNRINIEIQRCNQHFISKLRVIRKLSGKLSPSVLDVGSGLGTFSYLAQKAGLDVTCVEMNKEQAEISKNILGLNVYNESLESLSLNSEKFDIIFLNHVIEHVKNPVEFLNMIKLNYMTPQSIILIEVPNEFLSFRKKLYRFLSKGKSNHKRPLQHFSFFNVLSIKNLVESVSMQTCHITQFPDVYTKQSSFKDKLKFLLDRCLTFKNFNYSGRIEISLKLVK